MDPVLEKLAGLIVSYDDTESLIRPLLELLQSITGLDAAYLTAVDEERGQQTILFSRNTSALTIPEGLVVPWGDSLCKRAIDENRFYADDVPICWGDSAAARELGIQTYVSEPIQLEGESISGTLCGASCRVVEVTPDARRLLAMFAKLISKQVQRDRVFKRLSQENEKFQRYALTDVLTGIPNRRALMDDLRRALAIAERTGICLHVAFIDLDGFKSVNDRYGHDAGDRLLIGIANALSTGLRAGDFVARYGGDEFVVFSSSPRDCSAEDRSVIKERLEHLTRGRFDIGSKVIDYQGASVGVISAPEGATDGDELIALADQAMYLVKRQRRGRG